MLLERCRARVVMFEGEDDGIRWEDGKIWVKLLEQTSVYNANGGQVGIETHVEIVQSIFWFAADGVGEKEDVSLIPAEGLGRVSVE